MPNLPQTTARRTLAVGILFVVGIWGCATEPPPPPPPPPGPVVVPGPVSLRLDQAPPGAGGMILTVTGTSTGAGSITLQSGSAGLQFRVLSATTGNLRLLVRGPLTAGLLGQLMVPDIAAEYSVQALEVAGGASVGYVQQNPAAAQLRVVR